MLHSIHDIVCEINKFFTDLPEDSVIAPIAYTMINDSERMDKRPVTLDEHFDGNSLVPDDTKPVILYHKQVSLVVGKDEKNSVGRENSALLNNTYSMQMIVFLNRRKVNWTSDELFLYLQSVLPDNIKNSTANPDLIKPFSNIQVILNSANMNDVQVWQQEYIHSFPLKPEHHFFALNYSIKTVFKKDCFTSCLEADS